MRIDDRLKIWFKVTRLAKEIGPNFKVTLKGYDDRNYEQMVSLHKKLKYIKKIMKEYE